MGFVDCIKKIVKEYGNERVAQRSFLGLLEDYQAFEDVAPSYKLILKHWLEDGKLVKISKMSFPKSQWKIIASDIIHQTEEEGFKREVASDVLHKLLLGIGIVDSAFDWDKEFMPKKTINVSQPTKQQKIDNEWEKVQQQQREKKKELRVAKWEETRQWWKKVRLTVFWGITIGMAVVAFVSVMAYCYCRIVGLGREIVWGTLSLVSIASGVVSSIMAGVFSGDDDTIFDVLCGITVLMAVILIISLVIICYGWIAGTGHKEIWNLLCLISFCAGAISGILKNFFD